MTNKKQLIDDFLITLIFSMIIYSYFSRFSIGLPLYTPTIIGGCIALMIETSLLVILYSLSGLHFFMTTDLSYDEFFEKAGGQIIVLGILIIALSNMGVIFSSF